MTDTKIDVLDATQKVGEQFVAAVKQSQGLALDVARAFADALRAEEAPHGVRVTSVHPGRTDTDMQRGVVAHEGGEYDGSRFLRPESVARAVLHVVTAPPDADVTELSIRPAPRPPSW